jgi:hypothetical protein
LANGVFLNADQPMNIERILARDPNYHAPIAWLTAAKDRIRWLSRALVRAESAGDSLTPAQWADVYYFARASEIGEFLGRAEEVFNASLVEKRQ